MMLLGAEVLFYPTAIGSEPHEPELDTRDPWQRAMVGHAVSNVVPVVAANRIGTEGGQTFYGSSFIADQRGEKLAELGRTDEGVILATFDLDAIARARASWGFFRDRRPGASTESCRLQTASCDRADAAANAAIHRRRNANAVQSGDGLPSRRSR